MATIVIPEGTEPGTHRVVLTERGSTEEIVSAELAVSDTEVPPKTPDEMPAGEPSDMPTDKTEMKKQAKKQLSRTGADVTLVAWGAATLLLCGAAGGFAVRRRKA
ncbi:hypothetical protein [Alloscardovia macacae]|nr:hypothetical protein [Alloscardovia macacae]